MNNKKLKLLVCLLVLFFFNSEDKASAQQPGTLDATFNGNGKAFVQMASNPLSYYQFHRATAIAITEDRIYVTGIYSVDTDSGIGVVALKPDGSLDNTFDLDGKVNITEDYYVNDIVIQNDSKILLGGFTDNDFLVIRLNVDGSLDKSWGGDGSVETDITATWERVNSLAVQEDGKIIAAAYSGTNVNDITIARYDIGGTLDTSFGSMGSLNIDLQGKDERIEDVIIQPDGKILVIGTSLRGPGNLDGFVIRLTQQGNLDDTFNGVGSILIPNGGYFSGLTMLPDNNIICAGSASAGAVAGIYKLKPDGTLDSTFSNNGFAVGRDHMWTENVEYHSSGKIIVFGYTTGLPSRDFAILVFDTYGNLDECFGQKGVVKIDMVNDDQDYLYQGAVQLDGKLVITGECQEQTSRFAIARVHPPVKALNKSLSVSGASIHSSQDDATYQWVDNEGVLIEGATDQVFTPTMSGHYAVMISKDGCTVTSDTISFIVLGLEELSTLPQVSPNPTSSFVTIQLPYVINAVHIAMSDAMGHEIKRWQFLNCKDIELDLSEIKNDGLYLLRILTDNYVFNARVVKK